MEGALLDFIDDLLLLVALLDLLLLLLLSLGLVVESLLDWLSAGGHDQSRDAVDLGDEVVECLLLLLPLLLLLVRLPLGLLLHPVPLLVQTTPHIFVLLVAV